MQRSVVAFLVATISACSSPSAPDPAAAARAAAAAKESSASKEMALYDQMRASQSFDIAATLGDEIVKKYPASAAAAQVKLTLDGIHAKATEQAQSRRLAHLWAYAATPEAGGTQYTAAIGTKDPLGISGARVRLVLRQHPQWAQSVYLLLDNATFDCSKGCATLPVSFDDAPAQRMKAVIPPTGEPALFIDDDKGFIARMKKAQKVAITAALKGSGEKTFVFEVGGYDSSKPT